MRAVKTKRFRLYEGDNLEALRLLADNSVDSVVTDPPYGLGKEPDPYEMVRQWYKTGHYNHKSKKGFMGKQWDAFVPQPALWKEVYRVLKPGGHVLSFFGSRTYDIGVLAIRMAGFEIRDSLMWLYGSGFPKSLNVGKAVDAHVKSGGSNSRRLKEANDSKTGRGRVRTGNRNNGILGSSTGPRMIHDYLVSDRAKQFEGWGTSLKPAHEPIVLARKPLIGTVAHNSLTHGVGGINIDGSRISLSSESDKSSFAYNHDGSNRSRKSDGEALGAYDGGWKVKKGEKQLPSGRFPANVLLTHHPDCLSKGNKWRCHKDCPIHLLDQQSGRSKSSGGKGEKSSGGLGGHVYGGGWRGEPNASLGGFGDVGGASRFFYCSKASRKDRDSGLDSMPTSIKQTVYSKGRANCLARCAKHGASLPSGSSTYKCGCPLQYDKTQTARRTPQKNTHPTVKPFALMRYLCRLITPRNGIVLDLYMGSGSTGRAALAEGFRFIGMESDPNYFEIALGRISAYAEKPTIDKG